MSEPFVTPEQLRLVRNFVLGGAAGGVTTGLVASILNGIETRKRKAKADTAADDNVLYVDLPGANKLASLLGNFLTPGVALGGGAIAWMEAHKAISKIYKKKKLEELQREVDDAQLIDVNSLRRDLEGEVPKAAAETPEAPAPISPAEFVASGLPVGLAVILGYASHSVARRALGKMFPTIKPNASPKPTRVVVRSRDAEEDALPLGSPKSAALAEFLLDMACAIDHDNRYGLNGVVKAAAMGESGLVLRLIRGGNLDIAADEVGRAYDGGDQPHARDKRAALTLLSSDPVAGPAIVSLAASIVQDSSVPHAYMAKGAADLHPDFDDDMAKLASAYIENAREAAFGSLRSTGDVEKSAASLAGVSPSDVLSMMMDGRESDSADSIQGAQARHSTDDDSPILTDGDIIAKHRRKTKPNKDIIDAILAASKEPAATV